MATDKPDYLKECIKDPALVPQGVPVPLDQFNLHVCRRCANRGCGRSGLNNSQFDVRARDWKKLYFDEVQRADPADPRYDNVRGKNFAPGGLSISTVGVPTIDLSIGAPGRHYAPSFTPGSVEAPQPPAPEPPVEEAGQGATGQGATETGASPPDLIVPEKPAAPPPPPPSPAEPARSPAAGNTPFQQGMMIGGAPQQGSELSSDRTYVVGDD